MMYMIVNERTSPQFNLALEEYALTEMNLNLIILWRNSKAVIIGKNQNAMEEINLKYIAQNNIEVIRRQSGGGAVFHDLGNINFTFIHNKGDDDFDNYAKFTSPIISYLNTLGVKAELQGRNDLVIDGRKFCGNAQAVRNGRIMHHGCILYSADFSDLAGALKPQTIKIESKSIKSVRKRVTNIIDHMPTPVSVDDFMYGLAKYFLENTNNLKRYELTPQDIAETERLVSEKYSTWKWNYGNFPSYNIRNSRKYGFGIVEVMMTVKSGVIDDISIFGDFFGEQDKSELEELLKGKRHDEETIRETLSEVSLSSFISGMTSDLMADLILGLSQPEDEQASTEPI